MEKQQTVLIVEDEKNIVDILRFNLQKEGYATLEAFDGVTGLRLALDENPDLILLDLMLPGMDGFEVCRRVRESGSSTPILMLTARGELEDKVQGLDSGADDYLIKPFLTEELLARLRALVRRSSGMNDEMQLSGGDIVLDETTLTLRNVHTGESVRLGDKEFRILEYFLRNRGRILTREQLAQRVWGYDSDAEYNKIEVYLTFTRKKLAFIGSDTKIKAVRGVGYELQLPAEVQS